MKPAGGLKLELKAAARDDLRVRFAPLSVQAVSAKDRITLVTDARGRLRYRLSAGEYRLRFEHTPDTRFAVGDHGWTAVRLQLP